MSDSPTRWVVLKLSTTGIAHPERWRPLAEVVRRRIQEGLRPLVVLPSLPRMPDLLWSFLGEAADGGGLRELVDDITEQHLELAEGLGFGREETEALLRPDLQELWRLAVFAGVHHRPEEEASLSAEIMTVGELLLTRLAAAWLNRLGLPAAWHDARTSLTVPHEEATTRTPRLTVSDPSPDEGLIRRFEALPRVVVTQAGIAGVAGSAGKGGETGTVRFGHGGADFSAACFAAKLRAARCEIWTDGPGLFTADPSLLPSARLLRVLSHEEAQEILTTGGRSPHPRAIP
ncbi:MAG TPA: bifunctional aspartate kinase/diaminopimelate decarboxylase, partial [Thermoanaerobaculia bacterium]|nr:bifunctional aspartate kinase/diaminopimelate decarboxylase [Thermoanaerobaculia bacterium]